MLRGPSLLYPAGNGGIHADIDVARILVTVEKYHSLIRLNFRGPSSVKRRLRIEGLRPGSDSGVESASRIDGVVPQLNLLLEKFSCITAQRHSEHTTGNFRIGVDINWPLGSTSEISGQRKSMRKLLVRSISRMIGTCFGFVDNKTMN